MSWFHNTWGTIFDAFDPDNPRHIALHANMACTATSDQTILTLKHLLSALRRFPPEILEEIFLLCIPTNAGLCALSQVCSYWRAVALSTPRLWCKIDIVLTRPPSESNNVCSLIRLFLQRSGNLPLFVGVMCREGDWTSHPALDMLMEASDRWRDALLYLPSSLFPRLTRIKGRLGSLRTLEVYSLQLNHDTEEDMIIDAFQRAPLLNVVRTFKTGVTFHIPSEQLTTYRSTPHDLSLLSDGLHHMRNLIICHIETSEDFEFFPPTQINLPNLRTLRITTYMSAEPGALAALLDAFTVPKLTELRIQSRQRAVSHLITLVLRSSCSLRVLSMETYRIRSNILRFLEHTPGLTNLALKATRITSGVARGLTRVVESTLDSELLPKLQTLVIDATFPVRKVLDMLRSRTDYHLFREGVSDALSLDRLVIGKHAQMHVRVLDALCGMRERGLTVDMLDECYDEKWFTWLYD